MFSPCWRGFPAGAPVSPTIKNVCQVYLQSALRYWLRIWSWSPGAALWLPTAPQGWVKISPSTIYETGKVPLPYLHLHQAAWKNHLCLVPVDPFWVCFFFVEVERRWTICCSAWLPIDMYCLGQARVAEWLPSRPLCDRAVSMWRWPSPWILHSAQLACQVLQATWSIKYLNDDHSLMHSHRRPLLLLICAYI